MQKTPLQLAKTVATEVLPLNAVSTAELPRLIADWLSDCQIRQHSPRTVDLRRTLTGRLLWFLEENGHAQCGRAELRAFFAYLSNGHLNGGRWGKSGQQFATAMRPATVATYFSHARALFSWLVAEEYLKESPMAKLAPPVDRADQIRPFTTAQITALLNACQYSKYSKRDEAILRFLLDTGVRVTELCELKMQDVDLMEGSAFVLGKGNKRRQVCFGRKTARALRSYLRDEDRTPEQNLFLSERGETAGEPFSRWGIALLIKRIGRKARISGTRVSAHTFRHTFAISFLAAGGNVFALKTLLGHTSLTICNRYLNFAQADIAAQHRQFSPGDRV